MVRHHDSDRGRLRAGASDPRPLSRTRCRHRRAPLRERGREEVPNGARTTRGQRLRPLHGLLTSTQDGFRQEGQNEATPEGVLVSIDQAIRELTLDPAEQARLGVKLCNLHTSSLWDTLSELLLASRLIGATPGLSIRIDYPLEPAGPSGPGKDADVAVFWSNGQSILIDAITPRATKSTASVHDQLVTWIEQKYQKKFSVFCAKDPNATVAVVVSLIENETFYHAFPMKLALNEVEHFTSPELDALPGLGLAHACSFRCPVGRRLIVDPIATYSKPKFAGF